MKKTIMIFLSGIVLLGLNSCATWTAVKKDTRVVKDDVKHVSKKAWKDGKQAIHKATE